MRQVFIILASAMMIAGCGGNTKHNREEAIDGTIIESGSNSSDDRQLCGGFTEQREPTEEEMAMFRSVTGDTCLTLTPLSVSTQVVAGINYKFRCRYQDKDGNGHCLVVIYKPLPGRGEAEITSIEKL